VSNPIDVPGFDKSLRVATPDYLDDPSVTCGLCDAVYDGGGGWRTYYEGDFDTGVACADCVKSRLHEISCGYYELKREVLHDE